MIQPSQMDATLLRELEAEPWRFDYFTVLRHLERVHEDRPRIGDSAARRDELRPSWAGPVHGLSGLEPGPRANRPMTKTSRSRSSSNFSACSDRRARCRWRRPRRPIIGDCSPRRCLPALSRHLQSPLSAAVLPRLGEFAPDRPARPPDGDRFLAYVGSAIGIGSEPYRNLDSVPDAAKLGFAGLLGAQAKSASRLASCICGLFDVKAEVDEFVGSRLMLDAQEWSDAGQAPQRARRGRMLSAAASSACRTRSGSASSPRTSRNTFDSCRPATCASRWPTSCSSTTATSSIGMSNWRFRPAPSQPVRLGQFGQLGWTTWMSPNWTSTEAYRRDAASIRPNACSSERRRHAAKPDAAQGGRPSGRHQPRGGDAAS